MIGLWLANEKEHHWHSMENKRLFFEECAATMNMDPLQPENWYSIVPTNFFKTFPKVITF
jgi:hypothetical protein